MLLYGAVQVYKTEWSERIVKYVFHEVRSIKKDQFVTFSLSYYSPAMTG